MKRGDLIEVKWVDIHENPTGDPDGAELAVRQSVGYFWGAKKQKGIKCVVTTTTQDKNLGGQSGWCIYPRACIRKMRVIEEA